MCYRIVSSVNTHKKQERFLIAMQRLYVNKNQRVCFVRVGTFSLLELWF